MKLFDGGRAPNPRRVRIFMAEKGITIPLEPIDIAKGEHKTDSFTALNPLQRIPALQLDDGTVIAESIAICRFLEETQPEPRLFGRGPVECGLVEMWQRRIEFELLGAVAAVFRHTHPFMAAMEVPQVPAWADSNRGKLDAFLTLLDRHLADNEYLCGSYLSVADISGLVGLDFMKLPKLAVPAGLTHVGRWHAALAARPSAAA